MSGHLFVSCFEEVLALPISHMSACLTVKANFCPQVILCILEIPTPHESFQVSVFRSHQFWPKPLWIVPKRIAKQNELSR